MGREKFSSGTAVSYALITDQCSSYNQFMIFYLHTFMIASCITAPLSFTTARPYFFFLHFAFFSSGALLYRIHYPFVMVFIIRARVRVMVRVRNCLTMPVFVSFIATTYKSDLLFRAN